MTQVKQGVLIQPQKRLTEAFHQEAKLKPRNLLAALLGNVPISRPDILSSMLPAKPKKSPTPNAWLKSLISNKENLILNYRTGKERSQAASSLLSFNGQQLHLVENAGKGYHLTRDGKKVNYTGAKIDYNAFLDAEVHTKRAFIAEDFLNLLTVGLADNNDFVAFYKGNAYCLKSLLNLVSIGIGADQLIISILWDSTWSGGAIKVEARKGCNCFRGILSTYPTLNS